MQTIHIRIISPQRVILDANALSISSRNTQGNFDILPQHANFITLIEDSPIIIRLADGKRISLAFPLAILLAKEDTVSIYTYVAYLSKK